MASMQWLRVPASDVLLGGFSGRHVASCSNGIERLGNAFESNDEHGRGYLVVVEASAEVT